MCHLSHEITKKATSELKNRQVRVCVCVSVDMHLCVQAPYCHMGFYVMHRNFRAMR